MGSAFLCVLASLFMKGGMMEEEGCVLASLVVSRW
jgi:hypothetical protein